MALRVLESRLYYSFCCILLFFIAAAASVNGFYDKWHFRDEEIGATEPEFRFDQMVDGTANRPYVYRQLLPMLANWIDAQVPGQIKDRLFTAKAPISKLPLRERLFNSSIARDRAYFLRYWIVYALTFLFAWLSVYAMYLLCKSVGFSPVVSAFSAIILVLLMPYFQSYGGYFYDYPELAFFALIVWMALNFDWWWVVPIVALATCNKESILFFIRALYPCLRRRSSQINALAGTAALELTCAVVYGVLRSRFQHNPGGTVQMHFMAQVHFMLHPFNWFFPMERTYGVHLIRSCNPFAAALILWTLWRGWPFLPKVIQRHAQIAAVINLPLFVVFCAPGELRDLSFLYIPFLLLLAVNLAKWVGGKDPMATPFSTENVLPGSGTRLLFEQT